MTEIKYSYENGEIWRTTDKGEEGVFSSKLTYNQIVELLNNKTTNNEQLKERIRELNRINNICEEQIKELRRLVNIATHNDFIRDSKKEEWKKELTRE